MDDTPKTKRPWHQFNLRTMFLLIFVVSIPLAWVGYQFTWIRERTATLDRIMIEGGHYGYTAGEEWDDRSVLLPKAIREILGDLPIIEIVLPKVLEKEKPKIHQLFPGVETNFLRARPD